MRLIHWGQIMVEWRSGAWFVVEYKSTKWLQLWTLKVIVMNCTSWWTVRICDTQAHYVGIFTLNDIFLVITLSWLYILHCWTIYFSKKMDWLKELLTFHCFKHLNLFFRKVCKLMPGASLVHNILNCWHFLLFFGFVQKGRYS